ncbi:hypothetical protein [Nocardia brasiliensis]|uniref:hypothetical protein n=1 Tax=Nocardia brasiliensis TaxID=37326 RepID=UPI002457B4CE|nr:hypothetical protein [Nocardia brasiliensis]
MFDSVDESVCESDDAAAQRGAGAGLVVLDSDTFYDPDDAVTERRMRLSHAPDRDAVPDIRARLEEVHI